MDLHSRPGFTPGRYVSAPCLSFRRGDTESQLSKKKAPGKLEKGAPSGHPPYGKT